ncbi:hypothetical protein C9374_013197 [Naegleria lovaniensis]|uniref:PH domain-containing protein n=1 Tax=Naegleria lovaniensis TaxID=51637 RepID=A0AA88GC18_NAELO|nr:uncharacterized protein C9374_013197 [Naegleria lovaniensis]KAG2372745.1 hypothetical protein C9374_013197 [Naegleria lovaniensis]
MSSEIISISGGLHASSSHGTSPSSPGSHGTSQVLNGGDFMVSRFRRMIEDVCILSLDRNGMNEIIKTKYDESVQKLVMSQSPLSATTTTTSSDTSAQISNEASNNSNVDPKSIQNYSSITTPIIGDNHALTTNHAETESSSSCAIIYLKREASLITSYPKSKKKQKKQTEIMNTVQEDSFLGGSDLTPLSLQFFTFPNDMIVQVIACKAAEGVDKSDSIGNIMKKNNSASKQATQQHNAASSDENFPFVTESIDVRKHPLLKSIFATEEMIGGDPDSNALSPIVNEDDNNSFDEDNVNTEDAEMDYENYIENAKLHPPARSYHTFINTDAQGFKYYGFCFTKFFTYRITKVGDKNEKNVEVFIRIPSCICMLSRFAFHSTFLRFFSHLDQYLFEINGGFAKPNGARYYVFDEELLHYIYDFFNSTQLQQLPKQIENLSKTDDNEDNNCAIYDKLIIHFSQKTKTLSDINNTENGFSSSNELPSSFSDFKVEFDKLLFIGSKEEHFKEASLFENESVFEDDALGEDSTVLSRRLYNFDSSSDLSASNGYFPNSPSEDVSQQSPFKQPISSTTPVLNFPSFPTCDFDFSILTNALHIDCIVTIVNYLALEKPIIFHSVNLFRMVMVMESLRHLIYPFRLTSIYIPIAHEKIINFLEAPFPYMVGTHSEVMWNHFRIGFEKQSFLRRTISPQFNTLPSSNSSSSNKISIITMNETKANNVANSSDYEMINIPEGVCIVNLDDDRIQFVGEEPNLVSNSSRNWKWSQTLISYIKDSLEKSRKDIERSEKDYMSTILKYSPKIENKPLQGTVSQISRKDSLLMRKKRSSETLAKMVMLKNLTNKEQEEEEVTGNDPLQAPKSPHSTKTTTQNSTSESNHGVTTKTSAASPSLQSGTRKRSSAVKQNQAFMETGSKEDSSASPTSTTSFQVSSPGVTNSPMSSSSSTTSTASNSTPSPQTIRKRSLFEKHSTTLKCPHPIREIFINVFVRLLTCYELFVQYESFNPKDDMNMNAIFSIEKFLSLDNSGSFNQAYRASTKIKPNGSGTDNFGGHVDSQFLREFFKTQIFHFFLQKKCELFWNLHHIVKIRDQEPVTNKLHVHSQSLPQLSLSYGSSNSMVVNVTNTFYKLFDCKMQQNTERFVLNVLLLNSSYRRCFLYKRGRFRKSWKKRFFVLRDDNTLLYYDGPDENQLKGSIKLTNDGHAKIIPVKVQEKRHFEGSGDEDAHYVWTKSQQQEFINLLRSTKNTDQENASEDIDGIPPVTEQFPTPFVFAIYIPGIRLLFCCAESERSREEWLRVLRAKVMPLEFLNLMKEYLAQLQKHKHEKKSHNNNSSTIQPISNHLTQIALSNSGLNHHSHSSPNLQHSMLLPQPQPQQQQPIVMYRTFEFIPKSFRLNIVSGHKDGTSNTRNFMDHLFNRMPLEEYILRTSLQQID